MSNTVTAPPVPSWSSVRCTEALPFSDLHTGESYLAGLGYQCEISRRVLSHELGMYFTRRPHSEASSGTVSSLSHKWAFNPDTQHFVYSHAPIEEVEITIVDGIALYCISVVSNVTNSEYARGVWEEGYAQREVDPAPIPAETTGQTAVAPGKPGNLEARRAITAVEALQQWLHLSVLEVAALIGVSRSAVLYWKREQAAPRPKTARHLYAVYALVRGLRSAVGPEGVLATLLRAPSDGGPSAYALLQEGRYDEAEQLLRPILFPPDEQRVQRPQLIAWPDDEPAPPVGPAPEPRPPTRHARRVRLTP